MASMRLPFYVLIILAIIETVIAVYCYECDSFQEPYCSDPFDPPDRLPENDDKYRRNCDDVIKEKIRNSTKDLKNHTQMSGYNSYDAVCRKTVSIVDERKRIHRFCGFYDTKVEKLVCNDKTGGADYTTINCACRGEFCNHATARFSSSAIVQVLWPSLLLLWVAHKARNQV
ncbi:uncharacterized protein LOC141858536 [Brevipalpus obovatus]|uniref:uncharacterized protein LOC141858536 n=1 Tax=Brevipalpus obovatus TaxID=246614 RepID=UPI003D9F3CE2